MSNNSLALALVAAKICKPDEIKGCTVDEVSELERLVGIKFPSQYRNFLLDVGNGAGNFFRGTDIFFRALDDLNGEAIALLEENGEVFSLPEDAFVFSMHQGYEFNYFLASDGENPPVYQYVEGNGMPVITWKTFDDYIRDAIDLHTPHAA